MYFNVLSFKNGKTLQFQSEIPFSVDKLKESELAEDCNGFMVVSDSSNGQVISFRVAEVVTVASIVVEKKEEKKSKPNISIGRRTE